MVDFFNVVGEVSFRAYTATHKNAKICTRLCHHDGKGSYFYVTWLKSYELGY